MGGEKLQPINDIDVLEQDIANYSYPILKILLLDRTAGRNIIWASDDYSHLGELYQARKQIMPDLIIGNNTRLIQPRTAKTQTSQINRTRDKAEVFTPSWVCNAQNNLIDEAWFGRKNVFNVPDGVVWRTTADPIVFPDQKDRTWQKYIDSNRMEISCGEAPYLVSRYDAATGSLIPLQDRIGLLDRKLRIVNENADDETEDEKIYEDKKLEVNGNIKIVNLSYTFNNKYYLLKNINLYPYSFNLLSVSITPLYS